MDYSLLNAKFYDVPQNRERIIVIGAKNRIGLPAKKDYQITAGEALVSETRRTDGMPMDGNRITTK